MTSTHEIDQQRQLIRPLLAPTHPEDALTAYYALMHDPRRTQLTLHLTPTGRAVGFVAVCQTGQDLFVPLTVVRAPRLAAGDLLRQALSPRRPYRVISRLSLQAIIQQTLLVAEQQINRVYTLDASTFRRVINVMVQPGDAPFRFEIRSRDDERVVAAAGVNWYSDKMAELYVYVEPGVQNRGWGRAVAASSATALLEAGLLPLYIVAGEHTASQRLAYALGFRDSGVREFECRGQLREC